MKRSKHVNWSKSLLMNSRLNKSLNTLLTGDQKEQKLSFFDQYPKIMI